MTPAAVPAAAPGAPGPAPAAPALEAGARLEPLVWLQLLGPALLPLEALALLLALAGGDPGPFPWLERVLCWGIGSVAPALLLARRPADGWSLLLAQVPLRGRRPIQRRLSGVCPGPVLARAGLVSVSLLSLLLLSWCDSHGAVATDFSPLAESPRLVGLLAAAALLALIQWQAQQTLQALLWLRTPPERLAGVDALDPATLERTRLSLGIPLLLLDPLKPETQPQRSAAPPMQPAITPPPPPPESAAGGAVAVEPEQGAAEAEGSDLDQQIP